MRDLSPALCGVFSEGSSVRLGHVARKNVPANARYCVLIECFQPFRVVKRTAAAIVRLGEIRTGLFCRVVEKIGPGIRANGPRTGQPRQPPPCRRAYIGFGVAPRSRNERRQNDKYYNAHARYQRRRCDSAHAADTLTQFLRRRSDHRRDVRRALRARLQASCAARVDTIIILRERRAATHYIVIIMCVVSKTSVGSERNRITRGVLFIGGRIFI